MNDLKQLRSEIKIWTDKNLLGKIINIQNLTSPIEFNRKGIKDAINSPHDFYIEKLNLFYRIEELIKKAEYIGSYPDIKNNSMVKQYHYLLIKNWNIKFYVVVRELVNGKCYFYSIIDKIKNR